MWSVLAWVGLTLKYRKRPRFVHTALNIGGDFIEMSVYGLTVSEGYDETLEAAIPIEIDGLTLNEVWARAEVLAYLGTRIELCDLVKRWFGLRSRNPLCTDAVQLILGETPQYLSPDELYEYLHQTHTLLEMW